MLQSLRSLLRTELAQIQPGIRRKATMASPAPSAGLLSSQQIFDREDKYGAHNYHPLPVALCRGKGDNKIFFVLLLNASVPGFIRMTLNVN